MKPLKQLQLGKNGLTDSFLAQVKAIFEKEKVLKISILKSACRNKTEAKAIGEKIIDFLGKKYSFKLVGYVLTVVKRRKNQR